MKLTKNLFLLISITIFALILISNLYLKRIEYDNIKYTSYLNLTNPEFLRLKTFIDRNVKKLKIYIGDFHSDVNEQALINARANDNFGHGQIIARNRKNSKISMYCGDMWMDYIFYDRITRDKQLLVNNLNDANVVYIPIMLGSLFGYPNNTFDNLFHNMSVWLQKNEEAFRSKLIMLVFSHLETILHYK
jgi:hypothetical protein